MKALSVNQPWANLIVSGHKRVETRSWPTATRGWVAIHASRTFPKWIRALCQNKPFCDALGQSRIELGGVIGLAYLQSNCRITKLVKYFEANPTDQNKLEMAFGNYQSNKWGFCFTRVVPIPFIKCPGEPGFFELPRDVNAKCLELLSELK